MQQKKKKLKILILAAQINYGFNQKERERERQTKGEVNKSAVESNLYLCISNLRFAEKTIKLQ